MKKRYILLKDSPELNKGAILEEKCDSGDQGYICISGKRPVNNHPSPPTGIEYSRETIMKNPEWFREVESLWLTSEQIKEVKKFLKLK